MALLTDEGASPRGEAGTRKQSGDDPRDARLRNRQPPAKTPFADGKKALGQVRNGHRRDQ